MTKKGHKCKECDDSSDYHKIVDKFEEENDELTEQDLIDIAEAQQDIKNGRFTTHKEMKKKYGLK